MDFWRRMTFGPWDYFFGFWMGSGRRKSGFPIEFPWESYGIPVGRKSHLEGRNFDLE